MLFRIGKLLRGEVYNCINMPGDVYVLVRKKPTVNVA